MDRKAPSLAKITRPSAQGIIPRQRLFHFLDQPRDIPIRWVSGPPGSGKTSLAASYLDARKHAYLWYRLDERDGDIGTFFYYMGMALKNAAPKSGKDLPLLRPEYLGGIPAFTRRYFEDLYSRISVGTNSVKSRSATTTGSFVVFDNYQEIPPDSGFHEMIAHALDVIPEGVYVIILSRRKPPASLARLRAGNKIAFLDWGELRFTAKESAEFVRSREGGKVPEKVLLQLHKRTGGWAAGLMLTVIGSRIRNVDYGSIQKFPTKDLYDYFAMEIFKKADPKMQDFLCRTAFLARMTASMVRELTGVTESGRILSDLSENQYFTERSLDDNPIYQYQPLFREFLLSRARESLRGDDLRSLQCSSARLLAQSGRIEDAADLFREAEDWDSLIQLILSHAQELVAQGRNKTLQEWIQSIPDPLRDGKGWLVYWLAIGNQPFNPSESRKLFERAFQIFQTEKNAQGILLAWSAAVDAILCEGDDFTRLDGWIDWLKKALGQGLRFPSPEAEARVSSSVAGALACRQPQDPQIKTWIDRSLELSQQIGDRNLRLQACLYAVNYYSWTGDLANCNAVGQEIRKLSKMQTASPLMVLTWKWMEALIWNRNAAGSEQALLAISEGLEIAQKYGVHVWDHMLFAQGVYASLNKGDMATAGSFLSKMEEGLEENRHHTVCQYHHLCAWYHLLCGNKTHASLAAEKALMLAERTGMYFTRVLCRLAMAQVFHEKKEWAKANTELSLAKELSGRSGSLMLKYMCLIKEAQFALDVGKESEGLESLREAMALGKERDYADMFEWWQPAAIAQVCARALLAGIEVDYVQNLIRKRNLFPEQPPIHVDNWPWPLRIYTLGRFEIVKDGNPVQFSRKVQKKPLEMLKALIALGGVEIPEEQIADLLWPDADGDASHSAFTTTLSRLRQLLGIEKAIRVQDGKATIDIRDCWVDTWAFERMSRQLETTWARAQRAGEAGSHEVDPQDAIRLTEKTLGLYQGHFLPSDEEHFWTTAPRERLRSKYLRIVLKTGESLEEGDKWEEAIDFYEKNLDKDNLAEELYQRIMKCYRHLGEYTKAAETYQRCKKILSSSLGMDPSPKTQAIYRSIIQAPEKG